MAGDRNQPARQRSDDAFDALYGAIVHCEIAPGAMVSEAELAARFKLKRPATRVALVRLSVMGPLSPVRRRGYEIKPIRLRDFVFKSKAARIGLLGNRFGQTHVGW